MCSAYEKDDDDFFNLTEHWTLGSISEVQKLVKELKKKEHADIRSLTLSYQNLDTLGLILLVPVLKTLTQLEHLDLANNKIYPEGMEVLAPALEHLTNLKSLCLCNCKIFAEGFETLLLTIPKMKSLETINLNGNDIFPLRESCLRLIKAFAENGKLEAGKYLFKNDSDWSYPDILTK